MSRQPFDWLVVTTAPDRNGREICLLARAVYYFDADTLTVTAPGGQYDATQVRGHPMQPLAKLMLRQMFKREEGVDLP